MDLLLWLALGLAVAFNVGVLWLALRTPHVRLMDMCGDVVWGVDPGGKRDALHTCVTAEWQSHDLHTCMCGFVWRASTR